MWPLRKEKRVEALIDKADAALEAGRHAEAIRHAEKLLGLRHTSGFELKARALAASGQEAEAIRVLEEGVGVAPGVAPLWSWLGDLRSSSGDWAGAHVAFARVEVVDPTRRAEAIANDALVFHREGRFAEGLARIEQAGTPEDAAIRAFAARCRLMLLVASGRFADAIAFGERELDALRAAEPADEQDFDAVRQELGIILESTALAVWREMHDGPRALGLCLQAVPSNRRKTLLDLIREIDGLDASSARAYRLMCVGRAIVAIPDDDGDVEPEPRPTGYYTSHSVLADSPAEALAFVRRFEAAEWGDRLLSLELEEASELEENVPGGKGIFGSRTGRTFFRGTEQAG